MFLFTPFYPTLIEQYHQKQAPLGRRITREDASRSIDSAVESEDIKKCVECKLLIEMFPTSKISHDFFIKNNEKCENSESQITSDDFYRLLLEDKNGKKLANWIYLIMCVAYFEVYGTFQYEKPKNPLPWVIEFMDTLPSEESGSEVNANLICASIILNSGIVEQLSNTYTVQLTQEDVIYSKGILNSIPNKISRDEKNNIDLRLFLKKYETYQTKMKVASYLLQCYYLHYLRIVKNNPSVYCALLITFGLLLFVSAAFGSLGIPMAAFGVSVGSAILVGIILLAPRTVEKIIHASIPWIRDFRAVWHTEICNMI